MGTEPGETPSIEVRPDAAKLIREKGGRLYVWIDGAGMKHVGQHAPRTAGDRDWSEYETDGVYLFVDKAIYPPGSWVVVFHRLPRRRVDALYDGSVPAAIQVGMGKPFR